MAAWVKAFRILSPCLLDPVCHGQNSGFILESENPRGGKNLGKTLAQAPPFRNGGNRMHITGGEAVGKEKEQSQRF